MSSADSRPRETVACGEPDAEARASTSSTTSNVLYIHHHKARLQQPVVPYHW
jgi:hypothetical protein